VVLVLDDIHLVAHPEILRGLDLISSRLPESVVLALVGRARPPLRLARRAAAHELVELRGSDLMFSLSETKALLRRQQGSLTGTAGAHLVHAATGGWPVAVALTAARASAHHPVTPRDVQVARAEVGRFLAEEVLARQPASVQRFMLDTSVLDGITVGGANQLRDATDAGPHLDHLDRHQLVLPAPHADGDTEVWHQHVLLRDFLRSRVAEREPERWVLLRRRAARLAAEGPEPVSGPVARAAPDTTTSGLRPDGPPQHGGSVPGPLSTRELEVLRMLRSEYSLPEIARHLFVSYNTAKTHTQTIYRKLGVSTRSSAVQRARELGYLERPPGEHAAGRPVPPGSSAPPGRSAPPGP
jgi:ATP/maltotriose-dependent transcriptional regulator MalT